ncbi:MAG: phosphate ABC transporter, permease protein PstA, partial [Anaerolineae bacterium]|nr:phosphate ABC transporter, permease protein PstA [Anaerolineae bacterium]
MSRQLCQQLGFALLSLATIAVVLPILFVVIYIVVQGAPAISWEFVAAMPRDGMRAGGVWPAIVGTGLLTLGTAVFAVPVGVAVAIYLTEYARDTLITRLIRLAIINLAGVPSVVYGL